MKTTKRVMALLMAMLMVVSLGVTVFAEPATTNPSTVTTPTYSTVKNPSSELVIKNAAQGHTYNVYQLLVGTAFDDANASNYFDPAPESLADIRAGENLKVDDTDGETGISEAEKQAAVKNFLKAIDPTTEATPGASLTDEEIGNVAWSWVAKDANNAPESPFQSVSDSDVDGVITISNVPNGYYIIEDTYTITDLQPLWEKNEDGSYKLQTVLNDPDDPSQGTHEEKIPVYELEADGVTVKTDPVTGKPIQAKEYGSDTISRYMVTVSGLTIVEPKTVTPTIDKDIVDKDDNQAFSNSDGKADTAAIGDIIEFEITGTVPNTTGYKYYYYNVNDKMSKGLDLVIEANAAESFVVTVSNPDRVVDSTTGATFERKLSGQVILLDENGNLPNGATIDDTKDYYVYVTKDTDGDSFTLAFKDFKKLVERQEATVSDIQFGDLITIAYKAEVGKDCEVGQTPNTNTATIKYSNKPGESEQKDVKDDNDKEFVGKPSTDVPTGEGPEITTRTFVTELTILKVDENGKPLKGAEFTLTGGNVTKVVVETAETFELTKDSSCPKCGTDKTGDGSECNHGAFYRLMPVSDDADYTYTEKKPVEDNRANYVAEIASDGKLTLADATHEAKKFYVVEYVNDTATYVLGSGVNKTETHYAMVDLSNQAIADKKTAGTLTVDDISNYTDKDPVLGNCALYADKDGNACTTSAAAHKSYTLKTITRATETTVQDGEAVEEYVKIKPGEVGTHYKKDTVVSGETVVVYTTDAPADDAAAASYYKADGTTKAATVAEAAKVFVQKYKVKGEVKTTDNNEQAAFTWVGLNRGEYTLSETKTPEGYNTIAPIDFEITATYDEKSGTITWEADGVSLNGAGNEFLTVVNENGTLLPSTGGMGTTLFYILGSILLIGAGVILVTRRRVGAVD